MIRSDDIDNRYDSQLKEIAKRGNRIFDFRDRENTQNSRMLEAPVRLGAPQQPAWKHTLTEASHPGGYILRISYTILVLRDFGVEKANFRTAVGFVLGSNA